EAKQGGKSQLGARAAGLQLKCPVCKAKHPKEPIPPESSFQ
ncbi:14119_t:CDS:2, partial [Entrophospora sp. SA101]